MGFSRVMLSGSVGGEPTPKKNGDKVVEVEFPLVTERTYPTKNGGSKTDRVSVGVIASGELADCCSALQEGDGVYVEGKLKMLSTPGQGGTMRVRYVVTAERVEPDVEDTGS